MSKPSQSGRCGFLSKISYMRRPSDELISDPIHPRYSQENLNILTFALESL